MHRNIHQNQGSAANNFLWGLKLLIFVSILQILLNFLILDILTRYILKLRLHLKKKHF